MGTLRLSGFDITGIIGRGAMATVYSACELTHGRDVALKVLDDALAMDSVIVSRFMREAYISARLVHPNIVRILDVREEQGTYFLVMELVRGRSLAEVLRDTGPLQIHDALSIAMNIAYALDFAHGQGVVHRDVKPSNILIEAPLTGESRLVVIDFGIAWAREATQLTLSGEPIGTSFYMSPEQAMGRNSDLRSDIYSLGVIMYQMLAGKVPFTADNNQAVLYKQIHEPPQSLRRLRPDLPRSLEAIVVKAMEKSPRRRHQSISELFRALYQEWRRLEKRTGRHGVDRQRATAAGAYSEALMRVLRNGWSDAEALSISALPEEKREPDIIRHQSGAVPGTPASRRSGKNEAAGRKRAAAPRESLSPGRPISEPAMIEKVIQQKQQREGRASARVSRRAKAALSRRMAAVLLCALIVIGIAAMGSGRAVGALLGYAIGRNDQSLVRYLAELRPDLLRGEQGGAWLILISGSGCGSGMIRVLADRGAEVNVSDSSGNTPLHFCAGSGDAEAVRILLEKGALVNRRSLSGETPLHRAAGNGRSAAAGLLISKGADLSMKDGRGRTPLGLAASTAAGKESAETVRLFVERGAAVDEPDPEGRAPLCLAALSGNCEAAGVLLSKGASLWRRDLKGRTALHAAAQSGRAEMVRLLLGWIRSGDLSGQGGRQPR